MIININKCFFFLIKYNYFDIDILNKYVNNYLVHHKNVDREGLINKANYYGSFNPRIKGNKIVDLEDNVIIINERIKKYGDGDKAYFLLSYQCAFAAAVFKNKNIEPQFLIDDAFVNVNDELINASKRVLNDFNYIVTTYNHIVDNFVNDYKIIID